jgi:predicted ATPase
MELLERQAFLESLEGFLASAREGRGCLVLVGGEAGIGKASLVRAFCECHNPDGLYSGTNPLVRPCNKG